MNPTFFFFFFAMSQFDWPIAKKKGGGVGIVEATPK
jgi:hypothetical protein